MRLFCYHLSGIICAIITNFNDDEMARINLIYARANNYCIGIDGKLPWHLPKEFSWFKKITMGSPVIMGRRTYEDHKTALPGRLNVVITRQRDYQAVEGIHLLPSLESAIELAEKEADDVFVIGGVHFFQAAFPIANRVFETVVDADIDGDAFLPKFDFSQWDSAELTTSAPDEKNRYGFTVYEHTRTTT